VVGARLVGRDLVVDHVGAHQLRNQLPPRTGCPDPLYIQAAAPIPLDLRQALLDGLDRTARRPQVDVLNDVAPLVHRHHVGRDRADINAEEGGMG